MLEKTTVLKEFIIKQLAPDYFIFDIVSTEPISEDISMEIKKKMDRYLEPGIKFDINRVASIERPKSGKIKHFYSLLD